MVEDVCFSGGAEGADLAWGDAAKAAGHTVVHFTFKGHKGSNHPDANIIPPDRLRDGDTILKRVNDEVMHRSFPAHSEFVTNLLRRNFFYAVAGIDFDLQQVYGGTCWAIECFKMMHSDSDAIYVYDQEQMSWFQWIEDDSSPFHWRRIKRPPRPSGKWTGIGTRSLEEAGRAAIDSLFTD